MQVAIRVDASVQIGTGHFMRCLTLADGLRQRGVQILFASRFLPDHLRGLLNIKGHKFAHLESNSSECAADDLPHAHWLGTSQIADAKDTSNALSGSEWDWLVVDHYALDTRWETLLRRTVKNIFVIDDIANRLHDCDILLDQNFYVDMDARYRTRVPADCQLLLGPRYVLLREEFQLLRKSDNIRNGPVRRLLIIFGGVDADNYTSCVIEALTNLELTNLQVDVVIGSQHPFRKQIVSDCSRLGFSCHQQTNRVAELMAVADLAIGACGFTSYEFAAMQLPAILIPVTDIQATVAKELSKKGIAYALFPSGKDIVEEISAVLKKIIGSSSSRTSMSLACHDFVDAEGVNRVISKILEPKKRK